MGTASGKKLLSSPQAAAVKRKPQDCSLNIYAHRCLPYGRPSGAREDSLPRLGPWPPRSSLLLPVRGRFERASGVGESRCREGPRDLSGTGGLCSQGRRRGLAGGGEGAGRDGGAGHMKKADIVARVAARTGLDRFTAGGAVDIVFEASPRGWRRKRTCGSRASATSGRETAPRGRGGIREAARAWRYRLRNHRRSRRRRRSGTR